MAIRIIGIDCAVEARNTGLACGWYEGGKARIDQATTGAGRAALVDTLLDWASAASSTLIAIDAPLGWPAGLGQVLYTHEAGKPMPVEANRLFRRETDRFVRRMTGKQSLDVGADRIARTAHAALALLEALREKSGLPVPPAWEAELPPGLSAIEVYPAATLRAYGLSAAGYKSAGGRAARHNLLGGLGEKIDLPGEVWRMEESDDALDAALCVLAGADFLRGEVYPPEDEELAKKEGWIWVRR